MSIINLLFSSSSAFDRAKIIADGNSYVQGNGHTPFPARLITMDPLASNGAVAVNFGVSGQTTLQMLADQSSQVLPALQEGVLNLLLVEEGGNDIFFGATVSQAIDHIKTYCANARSYAAANSIRLRIIVYTKIHRNQSPVANYNGLLDAYNVALLADSSFYDGVCRPDLETIFATYSSAGYDSDGVHPNDIGQAKYASLTLATILSF